MQQPWQAFRLRAIKHPRLKGNFRKAQRCTILEFVVLSIDFERGGVVDLLDKEIASELEISLESWILLREKMKQYKVVREIAKGGPDDGHYYEVAPWLLIKQLNGEDKRREDCFIEATWRDVTPSESFFESPVAANAGGKTPPMTPAEKQYCYRERVKADNAGQRPKTNEEYLAEYRARAQKEQAESHIAVTDFVTENFSDFGNGNAAQTTEERESREDNNTTPARNGNASVVTESDGNGVVVDSSASPLSSEAAWAQIETLVTEALVACGVTASTIESRLKQVPGWLARAIDQIAYLPFWPDRQNDGGHLVKAICEGWAAPKPFIEAQRVRRKKRRSQEAQRQQARQSHRQEAEKSAAGRETEDFVRGLSEPYREHFRDCVREIFKRKYGSINPVSNLTRPIELRLAAEWKTEMPALPEDYAEAERAQTIQLPVIEEAPIAWQEEDDGG